MVRFIVYCIVTPAKAGVQKRPARQMDPRFREDDRLLSTANNTSFLSEAGHWSCEGGRRFAPNSTDEMTSQRLTALRPM